MKVSGLRNGIALEGFNYLKNRQFIIDDNFVVVGIEGENLLIQHRKRNVLPIYFDLMEYQQMNSVIKRSFNQFNYANVEVLHS